MTDLSKVSRMSKKDFKILKKEFEKEVQERKRLETIVKQVISKNTK